MRTTILGAVLAVSAASGAMAQTADEQLTFEVASVKPAAPMTGGRMMVGARGGPGSTDPGHLNYNNLSLKNLLTTAYGVKGYQISGPAFLDSERFDIVAKVPQGATKEQIRFMLQNLLKERFKVSIHHETKDMAMYALVVGKNGPKMKVSPEDPPPSPTANGGANGPNPVDDAPKLPPPGKLPMGPDGMPQFPAGIGPKQGCIMLMMISPTGPRGHMQCRKETMSALAEQLSNQVDRPVTDMTGLPAQYDFTLDFSPDENRMGAMLPPGGMPPPGMMGPGGSNGPNGPHSEEAPTATPLPAAVQEQLGLKLEQKKGPVDLIVIDKMEKVPTEN